jgi:hydrogenase maturation protease
MTPAILIAGVGNIFLGDDAFGVEVARSLATRQLPQSVSVKDFGIRGFDLAYTLLDPWKAVILVDALRRGEAPGTLYLLEPNVEGLGRSASAETEMNPHSMDPVRVLNLAASMGTICAKVLVVGCEPNDFGEELEGRMGLSPPVQAVVGEAVQMVEKLVGRILSEHWTSAGQLETTEVRL